MGRNRGEGEEGRKEREETTFFSGLSSFLLSPFLSRAREHRGLRVGLILFFF